MLEIPNFHTQFLHWSNFLVSELSQINQNSRLNGTLSKVSL